MIFVANGRKPRNEFCGYQKFETALKDEFKGDILSLDFVPLKECKSKCDDLVKCNNFEFCPSSNRCRLFHSTSDLGAAHSNSAQFFDCYGNIKRTTCTKGAKKNVQTCDIMYIFNVTQWYWTRMINNHQIALFC